MDKENAHAAGMPGVALTGARMDQRTVGRRDRLKRRVEPVAPRRGHGGAPRA